MTPRPASADQHAAGKAAESVGRADRKIDLARNQDEGHAHGHDPKQRNLPPDVEQVQRGEKAAGRESEKQA
jgi:hypothetical protein